MNNLDGSNPSPTTMQHGWTTVQTKKNGMTKEKLDELMTSMVKTKITILIRVPKETTAEYSAAEVHIATIRELSKQDANLIVLDHKGTNHVNIHKSFGQEKYKEYFQPRERILNNGSTQISIAHHVLSETKNFNKALLIPFLQKNKVFIYFNQKEGLEHFSAIGVFFGPHPELTWRQDIVERIEKTMKADLTDEDCKQLRTDILKPKIVISLVPQNISNQKYSDTKTIALEVRVPAEHEKVYCSILDRMNERACTMAEDEIDIILDDSMGKFFPYYAKNSRGSLFDALMKKQNSDMHSTSAIPLFGLTEIAQQTIVKHDIHSGSLLQMIYDHPNVKTIEKTASSIELGKYMILADRDCKEEVEEYIDALLAQIPSIENQATGFNKPQRGGNKYKQNRIENIKNYLDKLEGTIHEDISMYDDESEISSPPTRRRRPTISYAQATKRLSFQSETIVTKNQSNQQTNSGLTMSTSMSTLTQCTLDDAISKLRDENARAIENLRTEIRNDVQSMETRIAAAVIQAVKTTQNEQMEIESQSSIDTNTTTRTVLDRFDALTLVVQNLAAQVTALMEAQETNINKRQRDLDESTRRLLPPTNQNSRQPARSPPAKLPRARAPSPPSTPPPNGTSKSNGAQEGA
jgi:hypothetical protein